MANGRTWVFSFKSNVPEVISKADLATYVAAEIIGGKAETYAKYLAPVDTGNLRNSITHVTEVSSSENGGHDYTVVIGSSVEYAPYQELGAPNAHVPAHPYLRPALEDHIEEYRGVLRTELGKA